MTKLDHPHSGPAILCSCNTCCTSRWESSRRVFISGGLPSRTEPANTDDLDFVDSRQRYELGE